MGKVKSLAEWLRTACRTNRVLRTFIQAFGAYAAVNLPAVLEGEADVKMALEALMLGALAAGFSAVWKTSCEANSN